MKKYDIKLTFEELKLLDTKVSEEAQKIIDDAKQENSFGFDLAIMNEVLKKSLKIGKLTWIYDNMRSCKYCGKGDKNFDSPIYYRGLKFNSGFVRMSNSADICCNCAEKYDILHKLIDYILDNDLPIEIQKNDYRPSRYLKDDIKICYECSKEMQESQMELLPAVMEGYYRGVCPHCGAESKFLGNSHKSANKFVMIENPLAKEEVIQFKELVDVYNNNVEDRYKVSFVQSKYYINKFYIEEKEWHNGYQKIVLFNVEKKTYEKEHWFNDIHKGFEKLLIKYNYQLIEKK